MDMVSLSDRGNEAGDLRRFLSKDAPIGELFGPGQLCFKIVGECRRAVEGHSQPIVEFSKIRVGGDVYSIGPSVKRARLELERVKCDAQRIAERCLGDRREARPA